MTPGVEEILNLLKQEETGEISDSTADILRLIRESEIDEKPGDLEPGRDLKPEEEDVTYSETIPGEWRGNVFQKSRALITGESDVNVRNIPVEYDDGETRYLSFNEINELDKNIPLANKLDKVDKHWDNFSFEPIQVPRGDEFGSIDLEYPHKKELDLITKELTELKYNTNNKDRITSTPTMPSRANVITGVRGKLPTIEDLPKQFQNWEGETPPKEIVQNLFRHRKKITDKAKVRQTAIADAAALAPEGVRKANELYDLKRVKSANGKELQKDFNNNSIAIDVFKQNKDYNWLKDFESNVINPDYKQEIPKGEETVKLSNGKEILKRDFEKYQTILPDFNTERQELYKELSSIMDRHDIIQDAEEQLDLLKRNYSLMDKFGFNVLTTTEGLGVGAIELAVDVVDIFTEDETQFDYGRRMRERHAKQRELYRPDVDFSSDFGDDAFSSWSNMGRFLFEETGRQLPIFAIIAASGGAAGAAGAGLYGSAAVSAGTLGFMTAGQQIGDMNYEEYLSKLDDLQFNDVEYHDLEKFGKGVGFGIAEGALGAAPTFLLGAKFLQKGFNGLLKHGKDGALGVAGKEYFKREFAKDFIIGLSSEAISEGLTQVTQNAILGNPNIMEGVGHATFSGGFFGGVLGGGSTVVGSAMRNMSNAEFQDKVTKNNEVIAANNSKLENLKRKDGEWDGRRMKEVNNLLDANKRLDVENDAILEQAWENYRNTMGYSNFNAFKKAWAEQHRIRVEAREVNENADGSRTEDQIQEELERLSYEFLINQDAINKFRNNNFYGNVFELLKVNEKSRYDKIKKQAKKSLNNDGKEATEGAIDKKAYEIFLEEQITNRNKSTIKLLNKLKMNWSSNEFQTEQEARAWAKNQINKINKKKVKNKKDIEELDIYQSIVNAKDGTLNGYAFTKADGSYNWLVVNDNAKNNERTNTSIHEPGHLFMWSQLIDANSEWDWSAIAEEVEAYVKKFEPRLYQQMFGVDPAQEVEWDLRIKVDKKGKPILDKDGKPQIKKKYNPQEIVMGFLERVTPDMIRKNSGQGTWYQLTNLMNINGDRNAIDKSAYNDIIDFLITFSQKIQNNELTRGMLNQWKKGELLKKYQIKSKTNTKLEAEGSQTAGDTDLFNIANEAMENSDWNNMSIDEKIIFAQTLAFNPFWENYLKKRIKSIVTADETEIDALFNKFVGLDWNITEENPITKSFSYRKGWIDIIRRYDPKEGLPLSAWINQKTSLPVKLLGLAQESKVYGRYEDSLDETRDDGSLYTEIGVNDNYDLDAIQDVENEWRKILNIKKTDPLYDTTLNVAKDIFLNVKDPKTKKTVRQLLKTDPRRARTVIRDAAAKALRADVTTKLGTQKSKKFQDFITDEANLQRVIDKIAVKYRKSFPFLSDKGGTMDTKTSQANIASDEGSFVSDQYAGNDIWIPKNLSKMSPKQKADFIEFVHKAFSDGLVTRKYAKDGTIEYNGKDTAFKSLKDAFANELVLDATFDAKRKSPDMSERFEGVEGLLQEAIKRDSKKAFSISAKTAEVLLHEMVVALREGGWGSAKHQVVRDQFIDYGEEDLLVKIEIAFFSNYTDGPNGFIKTIQQYNLPKEITDALVKKALKWSKTDMPQLQDYKDSVIKFATDLDPIVFEILEFDFLGIHYKRLDPNQNASNEAFIKLLKKAAKTPVDPKNKLEINKDAIILAVDPYSTSSKLGKILVPIYQTKNKKDKTAAWAKKQKTFEASNVEVKKLRNYLAKELSKYNGSFKNKMIYLMLQAQADITKGFRSVATIEHARFVEGIQLPKKINPPDKKRTVKGKRVLKDPEVYKKQLQEYYDGWKKVNGWNKAWKQVKDNVYTDKNGNKIDNEIKAIALLRPKNEHLGANSETMGEFAVASMDGNIKTDADANLIFKDHVSMISTPLVLNPIDDKIKSRKDPWKGGRVNPLKEFRAAMYMSNAEIENHYGIDGKLSTDFITEKKAKEALDKEFGKTVNIKKVLQAANSVSASNTKGISIFDFDDTVAKTKSKVIVKNVAKIGPQNLEGLGKLDRLLVKEFDKSPHTRHLAPYAKKHGLDTDAWFWKIDWGFDPYTGGKKIRFAGYDALVTRRKKILELDNFDIDELRAKLKRARGENKENIEIALQEKFKKLHWLVDHAGIDIYTGKDHKPFKLTAAEFAQQSAKLEAAGAIFDFSEFNKVIKGKKGPLADLALKRQDKFGSKDIFILTARPQKAANAIHAFLKGIGLEIPIQNIVGLEDGRPQAKADWVMGKVAEGYNDFYFADDAWKNVKAVQDILKQIDVKSDIQQAYSKSNTNTYEGRINEIIEHQANVPKDAKYSQVVAKRKGAQKGNWEIFLPPTAEDFKGLLYYLAGKGKKGSADLEWMMENLVKPYFKGVDAIKIAKTSIKADYNALLKHHTDIAKKLETILPGTDFTYDQAVRMYIWNKQGQDIPGISKRDLNKVLKAVKSNQSLLDFANNVERIGNVKGKYLTAEVGWDVGTILSDLDNLTNRVGRKAYLDNWITRVDAAFTPDVLTKIEATYGTQYRNALEDIMWRMKHGTNRPTGSSAQTNSWINWINNSVGSIMFFNRRSALLQSISTINFLNWSDNNMVKAAAAFANQPQFWKDFVFIWNSPKLKQRRRGLQTDLQWQEIANEAKRGKNASGWGRVNAVISYLLKIGFTPTQLVDNFAIAAGGAPFLRNRINTYLKKGMDQKEAEQKAWDDFSLVAEETQQSGDPALISGEQASVLGRWILAFQNTPMQMTRLQKKAGMMLYRRQSYPGMSQAQSDFTNIGKIVYYGAIQNFIFHALSNALFALLPGWEGEEDPDYIKQLESEKEKKARTIHGMIDTLLRGSGIKGAVISTIKNAIRQYLRQEAKGWNADHTYTVIEIMNVAPPIGSKLRKLYKSHQTKKYDADVVRERGWSITADGRLNLSPSYEILGNAVSAVFNIPLDRAVLEIDAIVEATDNRNADWQRIALALGWRTWDVGARNEEEDIIKIIAKIEKKARKKKEREEKKKSTKDILDLLKNP